MNIRDIETPAIVIDEAIAKAECLIRNVARRFEQEAPDVSRLIL